MGVNFVHEWTQSTQSWNYPRPLYRLQLGTEVAGSTQKLQLGPKNSPVNLRSGQFWALRVLLQGWFLSRILMKRWMPSRCKLVSEFNVVSEWHLELSSEIQCRLELTGIWIFWWSRKRRAVWSGNVAPEAAEGVPFCAFRDSHAKRQTFPGICHSEVSPFSVSGGGSESHCVLLLLHATCILDTKTLWAQTCTLHQTSPVPDTAVKQFHALWSAMPVPWRHSENCTSHCIAWDQQQTQCKKRRHQEVQPRLQTDFPALWSE